MSFETHESLIVLCSTVNTARRHEKQRFRKMWDAYITIQTPLRAYTALEEETREVGQAISVIELLLSPEISGIPEQEVERRLDEANEALIKVAFKWQEMGNTPHETAYEIDDPTWPTKPIWVGRMMELVLTRQNYWQQSNLRFSMKINPNDKEFPNFFLVVSKVPKVHKPADASICTLDYVHAICDAMICYNGGESNQRALLKSGDKEEVVDFI